MNQKLRTLVLGGVLAAAVILLAIIDGASAVLILALVAVSALGLLYVYQRPDTDADVEPRARTRSEDEDEEEWEGEWAEDDEEPIDLSFVDDYVETRPAEDLPARERALAEEDEDEYVEEVEYEEEGEYAEAEDLDYADEGELVTEEYEYDDTTSDDGAQPAVEEADLDEEFEEAIAGYEEPSFEGTSISAVDEEELLDETGLIDETKVTSDEAILGAAHASSFTPDEEEANAETREILGRVAALLAKYE